MPTTPEGIVYPDSSGHTRLWEHFQTLADSIDTLLGSLRIEAGEVSLPFSNTTTANAAVSFGEAFSGTPFVVVTAGNVGINCSWAAVSASGFTAYGRRLEGATQGSAVTVNWVAIGPR